MLRTVAITVPRDTTDALLGGLGTLDGLLSLRVQRGISLQPPGDVVTVETTDRGLRALLHLLDERGVGRDPGSSITTSEPSAIISSAAASRIAGAGSEGIWEELEVVIGKESNMTANALAVMAIAGVLAAAGLATNALHVVIGAMVVAPGFEPIARIALGAVTRSAAWRRGLVQTAQAYGALVAGAAATGLLLRALGRPLLGQEASYLPAGVLVSYWTTVTPTAVLVSAVASVAGAVLLAMRRSVLTAGVMIALALVPAAAITALALVAGDLPVAGRGVLRWGIDAGLVAGLGALVFGWKQARVHRRKMRL